MANNLITNLHKTLSDKVGDNGLVRGLRELGKNVREIGSKLPEIIGASNAGAGINGLFHVKKRLLKGLNSKRKKFRLALEALGWGTLADMLDSALCGEKLNVWV